MPKNDVSHCHLARGKKLISTPSEPTMKQGKKKKFGGKKKKLTPRREGLGEQRKKGHEGRSRGRGAKKPCCRLGPSLEVKSPQSPPIYRKALDASTRARLDSGGSPQTRKRLDLGEEKSGETESKKRCQSTGQRSPGYKIAVLLRTNIRK